LSFFPCPECGRAKTKVIDSRVEGAARSKRRRRECPLGHRFTTYENVERLRPIVASFRHQIAGELIDLAGRIENRFPHNHVKLDELFATE